MGPESIMETNQRSKTLLDCLFDTRIAKLRSGGYVWSKSEIGSKIHFPVPGIFVLQVKRQIFPNFIILMMLKGLCHQILQITWKSTLFNGYFLFKLWWYIIY